MAVPEFLNNNLVVSEGQRIPISLGNISAIADGVSSGNILFTILPGEDPVTGDSLLAGTFLVDGVAATQFSQSDISTQRVTFEHDSSNAAPQYTVTAILDAETSESATPEISFTPFNDPITLVRNELALEEGETITLTPEANLLVTDETGESTPEDIVFTILNISASGQFQRVEGDVITPLNASSTFTQQDVNNGLIQFTQNGSELVPSYSLQVSDGGLAGASNPAPSIANLPSVTANLTLVNDMPVANDDTFTTDEDIALTGNVLDGSGDSAPDSDAEGDPLTATVTVQPTNGTLTDFNSSDGSFTYAPNENFNGTDTFTYQLDDGTGSDTSTDTATVTLNVTSVPDDPIAQDDAFTLSEDQSVTGDVLADNGNGADADGDGDPLTVALVAATGPDNGDLTLNPDGTFEYTPAPDFNGTDSFTYEVSDGTGGTDTAEVTLTIDSENDAPVANNDPITTAEDTPATGNVLNNDTDPDPSDTLTATLLTEATNGTVTLNADGSFTYTPETNFNGTDSFTYEVNDGSGSENATATATATITVTAENDDPVAQDDAFSTVEDTPLSGDVLADNGSGVDADVDGDALAVAVVTDPTSGEVTLNADGTFEYTPEANFNGTDTFTYEVSDGDGGTDTATVTITISSVNDAPIANDDPITTVEDTPATGNVLNNDTDPDPSDTLTATLLTEAANGTVILNADGSFTYTPDTDFNGTDSFTYEVNDGSGSDTATATATATITVTPENDAPVAQDDAFSTVEDTLLSGDVLVDNGSGADADVDGDALTTALVTGPTDGELTLNTDGTFEYTPDENFNGTDTFTYEVSDGNGGVDTATATITIDPVNDGAIAVDDVFTLDEDPAVPFSGNVLTNDSDPEDDPLTATLVDDATNGDLLLNADGSFTYTPDENFFGEDSFTYTASDGSSAEASQATVTLTVNPVNDVPVVSLAQPTIPEGAGLDGTAPFTFGSSDLSATDVEDGPNELQFTITSVTGGDFFLGGAPLSGDTTFNAADINFGQLTFVDDGDEAPPTYTVVVTDSEGGQSEPQTITAILENVNDGPTVVVNTFDIFEGGLRTLTIANLLAQDDETTDPSLLTYTVQGEVENGNFFFFNDSVNPISTFTQENINNQEVVFQQDGSEAAPSFTLVVSDADGGSTIIDGFINSFTPVNDAPQAADDTATTAEDEAIAIAVLANDSDVDNTSLTVSSVGTAANGTVVINPDNTITYTPTSNFNGTDTFTYTVSDNAPDTPRTDTATVTVTVSAVNDAPTLTTSFTVTEGVPLTLNAVAENLVAEDVESGPADLTYTVSELTAGSFFLSDAPGTAITTFTQEQVDAGQVVFLQDGSETVPSFTLTLTDADGGSTEVVVDDVILNPVNDAPAPVDDAGPGLITNEASTITFSAELLLANDIDVDSPTTSLSIASFDESGTQGTLMDNGDGTFTYDPSGAFDSLGQNERATDTFTYLVSDGTDTSTTAATVTLDIFGLSPEPAFFSLTQSIPLNAPGTPVPTNTIGGLPLAALFDENFYRSENPDVAAAVENGGLSSVFQHFTLFGLEEGRDPSILFNEEFYLANNPGVAAAVANGSFASGLQHFLFFGNSEGRDPSTLFDQSDYLETNPDVATAVSAGTFTSGFAHYIAFGANEDRLPTLSLFSEAFYLEANADVAAAVEGGSFSSGFNHFVMFGQNEGRAPSSIFAEGDYFGLNPSAADAVAAGDFANGFQQYESVGRFQNLEVFA